MLITTNGRRLPNITVHEVLKVRLELGHPLEVPQFGSYESVGNGGEEPCHGL